MSRFTLYITRSGVWILLIAFVLAACQPAADTPVPLPTLMQLDTAAPPSPAARATLNTTLRIWQPAQGQLNSPGDAQTWRFEGQADSRVLLRALPQDPASGLRLTLRLSAPNGALVTEGSSIETTLLVDGTYTLRVEAATGSGGYTLGLSDPDSQNPLQAPGTEVAAVVGVPTPLPLSAELGQFIADLVDGQTASGIFSAPDETHVYAFLAEPGQYAQLSMTRVNGQFDPLLRLYGPDGSPIAIDANSGGRTQALLRNIVLTEDGLYTLSTQGRGGNGGYSVSLDLFAVPQPLTPTRIITPTATWVMPALTPTLAAADPENRLQDHIPVRASLDDPQGLMTHAFYATAGEIVSIGVKPAPDSALIPRVEVIDPLGIPIAAATGRPADAQRLTFIAALIIQETGPHSIYVTAAEGRTTGGYTISYGLGQTFRETRRGEAPNDRGSSGIIDAPGQRDVWYAPLREGDLITAALEVTEGDLIASVSLVDEEDMLVGIAAGAVIGQPIRIAGVRIPADGLYRFRVQALSAAQQGSYTLSWRYISAAPTPTAPAGSVTLMQVRDSVADQQYAFLPFQGQAGQSLRIMVNGAEGFDPVAALLDPEAQVIAEADDSDGRLDPRIEITLPTDGTYNLRVNGYQQGGDFIAIVQALYE